MLEGVRRASLVVGGDNGDYLQKPRPMMVVQASKYVGHVDSLTVCPVTSMDEAATRFRIRISATDNNGFEHESVVCADKVTTIRSERLRTVIGEASEPIMRSVDEALKRWLAL